MSYNLYQPISTINDAGVATTIDLELAQVVKDADITSTPDDSSVSPGAVIVEEDSAPIEAEVVPTDSIVAVTGAIAVLTPIAEYSPRKAKCHSALMFVLFGICCCLVILVPLLLLVIFSSHTSSTSPGYLYYVTYPSSNSCSGNAIYQYAYPMETCLPSFNVPQTSMVVRYGSHNVTIYKYSGSTCSGTVLDQTHIIADQCRPLDNYPGYSMTVTYRTGTYISYITGRILSSAGYGDSTCSGKITEAMTVPYGVCLPSTQTTSVRYEYTASQICGTNCVNPATYTKYSYSTSNSCIGPVFVSSLPFSTQCLLYTQADTVSPYRTYDIPDFFQ